MPEREAAQVFVPLFGEWQNILRRNLADRRESDYPCAVDIQGLRQELLQTALGYSKATAAEALERLPGQGSIRRYAELVESFPAGEPDALIMSGHQPVIYHCGLFAKGLSVQGLCRSYGGLAVNVIMDLDEGQAGVFYFPRTLHGRIGLEKASLAAAAGLFSGQRLKDKSQIEAVFERVQQELHRLGFIEAQQGARLAADLYGSLTDLPAAQANSIVRLVFEKERSCLELPFSRLVSLKPCRQALQFFLTDGPKLWHSYNQALAAHRRKYKIENQANPFPSLKEKSGCLEMPFWLIDREKQTRSALWLGKADNRLRTEPGASPCTSGDCSVCADELFLCQPIESRLLAPRGAMITLFLRWLCCDLFVHGLGGAGYDGFVDAFAEQYFKIKLPAFVAVSASRYLFEKEIEEYEGIIRRREGLWHVYSHTRQYLQKGLFPALVENELEALCAERLRLVSELRGAGKDQKRKILLSLNGLNRRTKEVIQGTDYYQSTQAEPLAADALAAWYFREFPFFFFGTQPCADLL